MELRLAILMVFPFIAFGGDGVVSLDTKKTHIQVFLSSKVLPLAFTGTGARLKLDSEGLSIDGKMACRWPNGKFDEGQTPNMVLGYSTLAFLTAGAYEYKPCPLDVPIKSTWGDGGTGAAALYIEVTKVKGDQALLRFRGKELSLDLGPLKGQFRVEPPNSLSNTPGD